MERLDGFPIETFADQHKSGQHVCDEINLIVIELREDWRVDCFLAETNDFLPLRLRVICFGVVVIYRVKCEVPEPVFKTGAVRYL